MLAHSGSVALLGRKILIWSRKEADWLMFWLVLVFVDISAGLGLLSVCCVIGAGVAEVQDIRLRTLTGHPAYTCSQHPA